MTGGSEKRKCELAFEPQNLHVYEKRRVYAVVREFILMILPNMLETR